MAALTRMGRYGFANQIVGVLKDVLRITFSDKRGRNQVDVFLQTLKH